MSTAQQIWKHDKDIFTKIPSEVTLQTLNANMSGRMRISMQTHAFDVCFLPRAKNDLLVFLSGPARDNYKEPAFWRRSFSSFYEESCLYLDDPAAQLSGYAPAFFFGAHKELVQIIKTFCDMHGFSHVTFIGSCNTGHTAIYCSLFFPDSFCIAMSPIFSPADYLGKTDTLQEFPFDVQEIPQITLSESSQYFFSWNRHCDFDCQQAKIFGKTFHKHIEDGFHKEDNVRFFISSRKLLHPHLFQPGEAWVRYCYLCLQGKMPDDPLLHDAMDKTLFLRFRDKDAYELLRRSKSFRLGDWILKHLPFVA